MTKTKTKTKAKTASPKYTLPAVQTTLPLNTQSWERISPFLAYCQNNPRENVFGKKNAIVPINTKTKTKTKTVCHKCTLPSTQTTLPLNTKA